MTSPVVLSSSTLQGDPIVTPEGDKLGTLKEIMLDLNTGAVAYAVLAKGGVMGVGERLFAVPWRLLTVDTDEKHLVLDVDPDVLENSTGFDADDWPSFSSEAWGEETHRRYGIEPYWKEPSPPLT
jgi:sporulation protein YlmC with PRC-barrel domain